MVKRYEHRHGGMMPVNREVDTYVSSSDYATLQAERDALRGALEQIERMEINGVSNIAKWALEESRTALGGGE